MTIVACDYKKQPMLMLAIHQQCSLPSPTGSCKLRSSQVPTVKVTHIS